MIAQVEKVFFKKVDRWYNVILYLIRAKDAIR